MDKIKPPLTPAIKKAVSKNHASKGAKKVAFPTARYVISLLLIALGGTFIFIYPEGYQSYRIQRQALTWPQTIGEVISAEVLVNSHLKPNSDTYQPRVITRYNLDGKNYLIQEIYFNQSSVWESGNIHAYQMISRYKPGRQVKVYYNPEDPAVAVLDTSISWFTYFMMVLGCLLALWGCWGIWVSIQETYRFFANFFKP